MSKIEGIKSWERVSTGGGGWSKRDEWGGGGGWCSRWAARWRKGLEGGLADIYLGENIDISA